ncbi:hypothetical protein Tco_0415213 [Tanacetum coccineum]
MQTQESKIDTGKALDADLVDTESIRADSTVQDDNSRSRNDTGADDAYIRPIYDEEPMAEVDPGKSQSMRFTEKVISRILLSKWIHRWMLQKLMAVDPGGVLVGDKISQLVIQKDQVLLLSMYSAEADSSLSYLVSTTWSMRCLTPDELEVLAIESA